MMVTFRCHNIMQPEDGQTTCSVKRLDIFIKFGLKWGGSCIDCLPVLNNGRGQMLPLPRSAACAKTQYTRITSDYN